MKNLFLAAFSATLLLSACKNAPTDQKAPAAPAAPTTPEAPAAPAPTPVPEGTCYAYFEGKDVSAVQIIMDGDKVSGYMDWSPDEKDGGHGFIVGTKSGNIITADWTFMIEGSTNTEQVMLKIEGDKLMKANGELTEKNGKLVLKNPAKAKYSEVYDKVPCEKIAKSISAAKEMTDLMKKM
jgi:hypothetical protein